MIYQVTIERDVEDVPHLVVHERSMFKGLAAEFVTWIDNSTRHRFRFMCNAAWDMDERAAIGVLYRAEITEAQADKIIERWDEALK